MSEILNNPGAPGALETQFDKVDLCSEVVRIMTNMGFSEVEIEDLTSSEEYLVAMGAPTPLQRSNLILYFNNVLSRCVEPAPNNVRRALMLGVMPNDWLHDLTFIVLEYLLINRENYF